MATVTQHNGKRFSLYQGDCCQVMPDVPDACVDFSVFSPPFVDLFTYSDNPADMGNAMGYDNFFEQLTFLIDHLRRVVKPGRIVAVHCIDLPAMKERDGYIGLKDFSGDLIRAFIARGFIYHSRHTIWKDPLIEAVRTKAIGLMHKQLCKDSIMSRAGLPDYLLAFRNGQGNEIAIDHPDGLTDYYGSKDPRNAIDLDATIPAEEKPVKKSHNIWRAYASPVWMDIRQGNVLKVRSARGAEDEKHLCPLQLDTIARALTLWSNPNDVVLTPFAGVGSEVYQAVKMGRRAMGIELKDTYYNQAVLNCSDAETEYFEENPEFVRRRRGA